MSANAEKLDKALEAVYEKITKLDNPEFSYMTDKIKFLIHSYRADGNPVGLYEVAPEAVSFLNSNKEKYSKQISQKLIDEISKAAQTETEVPAQKAAAPKKAAPSEATVNDAAATATKAAPKAKKEAAPKKAATTPKGKK